MHTGLSSPDRASDTAAGTAAGLLGEVGCKGKRQGCRNRSVVISRPFDVPRLSSLTLIMKPMLLLTGEEYKGQQLYKEAPDWNDNVRGAAEGEPDQDPVKYIYTN